MGNGNNQNGHYNGNGNGHHPNGQVNLNGNGNGSHAAPVNGAGKNGKRQRRRRPRRPRPPVGRAASGGGQRPGAAPGPGLVSRRDGRGNRQYDYIEGHTVIDQANAIFGYGGWGYELCGDVSLRRIEKVDVRTGEVKVNYAYSAPVRVSVVGAPPRTDIGFHVVTEDTPEGHETAAKGAVTDGLKRALRSFGDRFGNGLYGDQPAASGRPRAQAPATPTATPTANANGNSGQGSNGNGRRDGSYLQQLRGRLIALGAEQGFEETQVREAVKKQTGKELDDLPARDLKPLVEGAARKVNEAKNAEGSNGNG